MDQLLRELHRLMNNLNARLLNMIRAAPPRFLQVTGILSMAAVLAGLYHISHGHGRQDQSLRRRANNQATPTIQEPQIPGHSADSCSKSMLPTSTCCQDHHVNDLLIPLDKLRSQLAGISTVTISAPGVLLKEREPAQLEESASVLPISVEIVKELASCLQTYLMAQVSSDIGEAAVRDALVSAGVLGNEKGQIPPHRLVVCETLQGKTSLVRQLEPELHIDGDHQTIEELQHFIPQQIHIYKPGSTLASCNMGIIEHGQSLASVFNVLVDTRL